MQKIHFYNFNRKPSLEQRNQLKTFIENIFILEKKRLNSLSYIFCSDEYLLNVNNEFLKHDFYTDVITFDLGSSNTGTTGEVYLSIDRIWENAKNEKVSFKEELHRVIFHGALHLCGYNDKKKKDIEIMRHKEDWYLKKYFHK